MWEGLWSKGPTRNDYEASGEFGVRTEGPKRERRIEEDVLPGIRGRWREGEEILRRERGVKGSHSETIYAAARQGLKKKLNNPRSLQAPYSRPEISRQLSLITTPRLPPVPRSSKEGCTRGAHGRPDVKGIK